MLNDLTILDQNQKNEIKNFINSQANSLHNREFFQVEHQNRDIRLDYQALLNNSDYEGLGTSQMRTLVKDYNSSLPDFKVNIAAGNLLEQAYGDFTRYHKSDNHLSQVSQNGIFGLRTVRPDFMHATSWTGTKAIGDATETTITFYAGGPVEVKCPQNPITLQTNNNQIEAEINIARYARGDDGFFGETVASDKKAGSFTLVLPAGANIDPAVITYATSVNVNIYVVYAFFNRSDYSVVFSNPIRKNNISIEVSYNSGNLDTRARLDIGKAIARYSESNDSSNE